MQQCLMIASRILRFVDFTKTQKSKYLKKETLFFLQIKKFINYTTREKYFMARNTFVAEVTFNTMNKYVAYNLFSQGNTEQEYLS